MTTCLHVEHLTYLRSFVALSVPEAWALAHAEGTWRDSVQGSLQWLWQYTDAARDFSDWQLAWPAWRDLASQHPRRWKRLVKRAQATASRLEVLQEGWQQCRGLLAQMFLRWGATQQIMQDAVRGRREDSRQCCGPCKRVFASRQQWAVHAFKVHGRVRPARTLVDGDQCPVCLKQFSCNVAL